MEKTAEMLEALGRAGADVLELGIPFSDPLADGATLQRINHLALQRGVSLRSALELVASVRDRVEIPIVLMSYYNPLVRLGEERFAVEAAAAGVDGVIVPDLPVEESSSLRAACVRAGVDLVGMVAPTTPIERMAAIAEASSGFLYCVSLKGVTGSRRELPLGIDLLIGRVREVTRLPAVVGFGISSAEQVRRVAAVADGVVVGSALMDLVDREQQRCVEAAAEFVSQLKAGCREAGD